MIRFVYIGDQIHLDDNSRDFAIYDTVTDSFICLLGNYIFGDVKELTYDLILQYGTEDRNRILNIIPDWYRNGDKPPWIQEE